jgi:Raf kinase inhibitor-like YbhB/YbcL family protein
MKISSTAFSEGEMIPQKYTCDGKDISPPLAWTGVPAETRSLALIADDPDAPVGTWTHWVAFNIPSDVTELPEAAPADETLPNGGIHGNNSWRRLGYGGPCPPGGTHRYFFGLYALDAELDLEAGTSKKDVEQAMKGHILAEAQLMGKYKRS